MNTINVKVNFKNGSCDVTGINLITGDYNSTKMVFEFDRDTGTKVFEMKSPSEQLVMVQEIQNNEIILYGLDEDENIASILNEEGYYVFEISLYENESKLTSARGKIKVKPEQVIVDGEVVEAYLPIFDQLLSQVNTAITQTNNLNLASSKSDKITTITITKKDGTTETRQVLDGDDFEYNWSGTQLGVKTSAESDYTYVDLKGDKGEPGAIKFEIVDTLPVSDIKTDTIYLVPYDILEVQSLPETGLADTIYIVVGTGKRYVYESSQWIEISTDNRYIEYLYVNNNWERMGAIGIAIDLSKYYTKTETNNLLSNKVGFTDYATSSTGGVFKTYSLYGTGMSNSGQLLGIIKSYDSYNSSSYMSDYGFICKGTLENVITGKGLTTKSYVDGLVGDIQTLLDNLDTGAGV